MKRVIIESYLSHCVPPARTGAEIHMMNVRYVKALGPFMHLRLPKNAEILVLSEVF